MQTLIRLSLFILISMALAPIAALRAEESDNTPPQASQQDEQTADAPIEKEQLEDAQSAEDENASEYPDETQADAKPATDTKLPQIFSNIESIGLYSKVSEGGMGKDLWGNTKRSTLTSLIQSMPASSQEPSVQRLIFGMLLTAANASNIENDAPLQAGNDLLTLRMEKLLEGGAYRQAFDLYSQLKEEPYHPRLARAGVLAMLYSGQKSAACLETNVIREQFPDDEFAGDITAYCNATMADAQQTDETDGLLGTLINQQSYRFQYTPQEFSNLGELEQALLVAENRITIPDFKANSVPTAHLQIFLEHKDLSDEQRFALTTRAVGMGLAGAGDLKDLFVKSIAPAAGQDAASASAAASSGDSPARLAYLYSVASDKMSGADQWETLRAALALENDLGTASLRPFAALLHKVEPKNASVTEIISGFRVFAESGQGIPRAWASALSKISEQDIDINTYSLLMAAAYVSDGSGLNSEKDLKILSSAVARAKPEIQILVNNIIENVDKKSGSAINTSSVYENELNLTFTRDYVMPSVRVWDRAKNASQDKAISETILLNTVLLRSQALQSVYPGLLRDVLQGFENVGLTDISEDMAMTALLGNIE